MISAVNLTTSFAGKDKENRVSATEVGVATGATVGGAKYSINAFKRFKNSRDWITLSGETVGSIKNAAEMSKKAANIGSHTKKLSKNFFVNAKNFKTRIIKFAKNSKLGKFLKPVFESKAFAKVSGAVGALGALFVFVSGIGEMGKTFAELAER